MEEELVLKVNRGSVEFAWVDDDLAIDAENSDERVWLCLNSSQAQELFEYLQRRLDGKGKQS